VTPQSRSLSDQDTLSQNVAFGSFLGFTLLQFVFALAANSEAMLADCAAMSVDAVTYLFNFCAERLKRREDTEEEKLLSPEVLHRWRKLRRLYLELFPPLISVATLVVVTILTLKKAIQIIVEDGRDIKNLPDVQIMLVFSALNLLLDALNVTCFARAEDQVVGWPTMCQHHDSEVHTEMAGLLSKGSDENDATASYSATDTELSTQEDDESTASHEMNLNMCSAWTVRSFCDYCNFVLY
jgi:Co/Zn/Cd efflux system component